jgi:hypothetical protein
LFRELRIVLLCAVVILILAISDMALCAPDEVYGVVSKIIDGRTFIIAIEKADSRITYSTERVVLADIDSLDLDTPAGLQARDLAGAILYKKRVFLDINDFGNSRDAKGNLVCVMYLGGYYGQPLLSPCYNRILVDSGCAQLNDTKDNEFNPADWWSTSPNKRSELNDTANLALKKLEIVTKGLLSPVQSEIGKAFDQQSKETGDWIKKEFSIK